MAKAFATGMAAVLGSLSAHQQASAQDGGAYEIIRTNETSSKTGNGSTGSTFDRDAILVRLISQDSAGVVLEFGFPPDTEAQQREIEWQLPARVRKTADGMLQLLNQSELEARRDAWLKTAKISSAACGHHYFTWNVFEIECDPQSAIDIAKAFDLQPLELRDGASLTLPLASAPGLLKSEGGASNRRFTVTLQIDPAAVQQQNARSDVIVAEVSGRTLSFDDAMKARSKERISGTMTVTFETEDGNLVQRRVIKTHLETVAADGSVQTKDGTETLERQLPSIKRREST